MGTTGAAWALRKVVLTALASAAQPVMTGNKVGFSTTVPDAVPLSGYKITKPGGNYTEQPLTAASWSISSADGLATYTAEISWPPTDTDWGVIRAVYIWSTTLDDYIHFGEVATAQEVDTGDVAIISANGLKVSFFCS